MAAQDIQLLGTILQYAQPSTLPTIRRSQYLADALQSLQETGAENLRTPTALWGKLAGQAILQGARDKNYDHLSNQLMGDQQAFADQLTRGIPGWGDAASAGPGAAMGEALSPTPQATPPQPAPAAMLEQQQGEYPRASFAPPPAPPQPAPQVRTQQPPGGIPTQPILPQEIEQAKAFLLSSNPQIRAKGIEMVQSMRQRMLTPIDPSKPQFVADGQGGYAVRDLGKEVTTTPGAKPGQFVETTKSTGAREVKDLDLMGKTEPGSVYDPTTGAYTKLPTVAGGRVMPFGAMSPEQVLSASQKIGQGKQVVNYTTLRSKAAGALEPDGLENNATDLNLIDVANTALANNPDLAVSEGFFNKVEESQGGLAKFIARMKNDVNQNGLLNQEYRNRLKKVIAASLHHRYDAARQEAEMARPGLDLIGLGDQVDAVLETLPPPIEFEPPSVTAPTRARGAQPPPVQGGSRRIRNVEEYNALPPGPYIDPDGAPRVKP
jgi:hypothetical protein